MKKTKNLIIIAILFLTIVAFCIFRFMNYQKNKAYITYAQSQLSVISSAFRMYHDEYGSFPYVNNGNSKTSLKLLLDWYTKQTEDDFLMISLKGPFPRTKEHQNTMFYETFNFTTNQWAQADKIWKKEVKKAKNLKSNHNLIYDVPLVWEKKLTHNNGCIVLVYQGGSVFIIEDGKEVLQFINKVKEELKPNSTNPSKPQSP